MTGKTVKSLTMKKRMSRMLVFALALSMLLVPVHVEKVHAFDWLDPPKPGAADGWYETKGGKYQGEYTLWEWTTEYELNDAGQVIKEIQNNPDDPDGPSTTYYEYDSQGRVSRYTIDGNTHMPNYQYVYDYKDDGSIVTTESWDMSSGDGEVNTHTNIRTYIPTDGWWYMGEWHLEFDAKGRLIHRWCDTYTQRSEWTCTYEEDDQGRTIKGTIDLDHAGLERLYTYNNDGGYTMREASKTGYEEFTYNKDGQLTQYVNSYADEPIAFDYTYDEAGNNTLIDNGSVNWKFEYRQLPEPVDPGVSFVDVPDDAYYAEPVQWAVENEITNGLDETHFGPDKNCTRAQMVTFLWRAAGEPEPTITENPFTDVKEGDYYYKAVLWAVEKKITSGTSATTFSPGANVSREQTVTFLWRKAGEPEAGSDNPFVDVPAGVYYTNAVLWAVKNNVTNGMEKQTFGVGKECTRAQIVTFLFRAK